MTITIVLLALVIGAIGFIVVAARRMQGQTLTGQMFRRAFQYALLYVLLLVAANGLIDLLGRLFGSTPAFDDDFVLAQSITAVVIAVPLIGLLGWWIYRTHRHDPAERESLLYQAYLTAAALTGAGMTAIQLQQSLTTAFGTQTFDDEAVAGVIIWAAVWGIHWRTMQRTLKPANALTHLLLGATIGLVLASGGMTSLLATSLELLGGHQILAGPFVALGSAAGTFISGALLWVMYWLLSACRLPRGTAWHTYVLLLGVAGGLITGLVGAQVLLWRGLVQLIGDPGPFVTWFDWHEALAALLVGAMVWWYHRQILDRTMYTPVRRIYQYLVAGIGVIATAAGIGLLLIALLDAITPATLFHNPINTLIGALTLLVIAIPLWWSHWRAAQRSAQDDPAVELAAVPRRIYLIVLVGASSVAGVLALISAVATIIHDAMQNQLNLTTLYEVRTEIGYLAASMAIIGYHVAIMRQDQHNAPTKTAPQVQHGTLTLIGPAAPVLVSTVAGQLNGPVRLLIADTASRWDMDALQYELETRDPTVDAVIIAREHGVETYATQELRHVQ